MPRSAPPAKVACVSCHERRVRCDRGEDGPCSSCVNARRVCALIVSRRGRKRKLPLMSSQQTSNTYVSNTPQGVSHEGVRIPTTHVASPRSEGSNDKINEPCFPAPDRGGRTPYVGDSSNLNYLVQQFGNPFGGTTDTRPLQDHLQGAMLARVGMSTAHEIERIHKLAVARLKEDGAFDVPPPETSQALLDVYFLYSLAALPIIDKSDFILHIEKGSCSHLLLNAVYLTATVYCSDSIIAAAGFPSRYAASLTFYRRAKMIYDAGYEADTIATMQATLLMCHWWSGLLEPKDPWYWLGISAGLAQALGLHQAKSYVRLDGKIRKLWRRLWWMIYTMDISLSTFLDRPPHIQGRLCTVPPLDESDFDCPESPGESGSPGHSAHQVNTFVISTMQLARIVDRFFTIKLDEHTGHSQDICLEQISLWSNTQPPEFQSLSTNSTTWTILTRILYQTYRLLLHRNNPRFSISTGPGTPTFEICTDIYHMLEILIAKDLIYAVAGNIIASVLSVLSIQIVNIHKMDTGVRMISEHRARFCMTILDKLQDRLPVVAAFLPIYESLLKSHSAASKTQGGDGVPSHSAQGSPLQNEPIRLENEGNTNISNHTGGLFDQALQDSAGAMFPFSFPFGDLFEDVFLGSSSQPTTF
ncbi:transcriptional regulator family: Fungal Specific TF [Penicillium brevicompactum]|uniref:Transcriptional regulator family: Fungal Specific TF n=1 Tax=Penicillium brevicompactum TaxID=5074 RepID=A0A9W9R3V8_PENBR|nr:transcriptional regulator family: Fungal Specific TF [Penicillium brevicompactum]